MCLPVDRLVQVAWPFPQYVYSLVRIEWYCLHVSKTQMFEVHVFEFCRHTRSQSGTFWRCLSQLSFATRLRCSYAYPTPPSPTIAILQCRGGGARLSVMSMFANTSSRPIKWSSLENGTTNSDFRTKRTGVSIFISSVVFSNYVHCPTGSTVIVSFLSIPSRTNCLSTPKIAR